VDLSDVVFEKMFLFICSEFRFSSFLKQVHELIPENFEVLKIRLSFDVHLSPEYEFP
jgi:hypothetical protein